MMSNKEKFWKMWRIVLKHLKQSLQSVNGDSVLYGNIQFTVTTNGGVLSCLFLGCREQLNTETDHLEAVFMNQALIRSLNLEDMNAFDVDHNTSRSDLNILLSNVEIDWNQAIPEVLDSLKECNTFSSYMTLRQYEMFVREMESLA